MKNIYRHQFTATCPNNGQTITYSLELSCEWTIMVEDIQEVCVEAQDLGRPYHENIADLLHAKLGGKQVLRAFHHGVEIESHRGF